MPGFSYRLIYKTKRTPGWVSFLFGGEGGIRTLELLLTVTRFPIVRARPATRLLQVKLALSLERLAIIIDFRPLVKAKMTTFLRNFKIVVFIVCFYLTNAVCDAKIISVD